MPVGLFGLASHTSLVREVTSFRIASTSAVKFVSGAVNVVAPETNFTADVDAILKLVTSRTKLVWLANPNNPTGTYLPFDEVKRLRARLPGHVLLVLDAVSFRLRVAQ